MGLPPPSMPKSSSQNNESKNSYRFSNIRSCCRRLKCLVGWNFRHDIPPQYSWSNSRWWDLYSGNSLSWKSELAPCPLHNTLDFTNQPGICSCFHNILGFSWFVISVKLQVDKKIVPFKTYTSPPPYSGVVIKGRMKGIGLPNKNLKGVRLLKNV